MKDFIDRLKAFLASLTVPDDKKTEFETLIAGAPQEPAPGAPPVPGTPPAAGSVQAQIDEAVKRAIEPFAAQVKVLNDALGEESKQRAASTKALAEQLQRDADKRVQDLLDAAVAAGQIAPKDEAAIGNYKKILTADFETGKAIIDALPKTAAQDAKKPGQPAAAPASETTAPRGFQEMAAASAAFETSS